LSSEDAPPPSDKPPGPASRLGIIVIAATLVIDQATKWIAQSTLNDGERTVFLPLLDLTYEQNTGIAFSFLRGADSSVLLGLVVLITLVVLLMWQRSQEGGRVAAIGFALIIGGAVGNIVDRIVLGYVIDFLILHWGDRILFIFNLADFALTLGPLLLIYAYLRPGRAA